MSNYTLAPNPASGKNYIIFENAPYLLSSLVVSVVATAKSTSSISLGVSTPLIMGVDYFPALLFNQATAELGVPVYGGVAFVDPALAGLLTVTLTSIGSQYAASGTNIANLHANDDFNPLTTWWETAFDDTPNYPHTSLPYSAESMKTVVDVEAAITAIAVQETGGSSQKSVFDFTAHTSNMDNPHGLTAEQIGLEQVPNWITGTASSIIAGGSAVEFVTPLIVKDSTGSVVPHATQDVVGLTALNQGSSPGDATNNTDGLTAAGLAYLLENHLIDGASGLVNNQRQAVQFTPFPIVYPAVWMGTTCNTFEALVNAVQTATGISKLTAIAQTGVVYFPHTAVAPNLALG